MRSKFKEKLLVYQVRTKKDPDAFGQLYDLYVAKIYRFVYFKILNKEEAEDLTSEVFLKIWGYLIEEAERKIKSFSGLIYSIARNMVIDYYRERAKKKECSIEHIMASGIANESEGQEKIERQQETENLMRLLRRLKQEYQEVVLLKYVEELSIGEIAEILGKRKVNVRVTLHRAMKKLKQLAGE